MRADDSAGDAWGVAACLFLVACTPVDDAPTRVPDDTGSAPAAWVTSPREARDLDDTPGVLRVHLLAARTQLDLGDGVPVEGYGYAERDTDGGVVPAIYPGPTLRARVGDIFVVTLENTLDVPTTIHWHGVAAPESMDGAGWMDTAIAPGESFTYTFPLTRAGTAWYHPHIDVARQVDLGLQGFLVVEDPAEPVTDELLLDFDTWGEGPGVETTDTDPGGQRRPANPAARTGGDTGMGHGGGGASHVYTSGTARWVVNGRLDAQVLVPAGKPVRARLLNASNTSWLDLRAPEGATLRLLADDQGLRGGPEDVSQVVLAPGDRAEVEVLVPTGTVGAAFNWSAAPYSLAGGETPGAPLPVVRFFADGGPDRAGSAAWPFTGALPTPDPGRTDLAYVLTGDTHTDTWRINGERWPDVTPAQLALGAEVVIDVRNLSATRHPFHVHGHRFEVLSIDGVVPAVQTWADTVDVGIRGRVRLRMVADNPGRWMVHCHVLEHEAAGMMTLFEVGTPVVGVSRPTGTAP